MCILNIKLYDMIYKYMGYLHIYFFSPRSPWTVGWDDPPMYLYTLVYQQVLVCKTSINHINIGLMFTNLSPICAYPLVITVVSHDQSLSMVFHGGIPNKSTLIIIVVTICFVVMVYLPLFGDPTNHHPAAVATNPLRRRWSSSRSAPPGRRRRRPGDSHRGAAPPRPRPRPWRPRRLPREGTPPFRLSPKGGGEKRRKA